MGVIKVILVIAGAWILTTVFVMWSIYNSR